MGRTVKIQTIGIQPCIFNASSATQDGALEPYAGTYCCNEDDLESDHTGAACYTSTCQHLMWTQAPLQWQFKTRPWCFVHVRCFPPPLLSLSVLWFTLEHQKQPCKSRVPDLRPHCAHALNPLASLEVDGYHVHKTEDTKVPLLLSCEASPYFPKRHVQCGRCAYVVWFPTSFSDATQTHHTRDNCPKMSQLHGSMPNKQ